MHIWNKSRKNVIDCYWRKKNIGQQKNKFIALMKKSFEILNISSIKKWLAAEIFLLSLNKKLLAMMIALLNAVINSPRIYLSFQILQISALHLDIYLFSYFHKIFTFIIKFIKFNQDIKIFVMLLLVVLFLWLYCALALSMILFPWRSWKFLFIMIPISGVFWKVLNLWFIWSISNMLG